jgi:hypothetical protein
MKTPSCINNCGEMVIDKHIKAKDRKKEKPFAKASITKFKCSVCDYRETVYAQGYHDFRQPDLAKKDVEDFFKNQSELNNI